MTRKFVILVLIFLMSTAGAGAVAPPLLRDGFVMNSVDGKVIGPDGNDMWFFELASVVTDSRAVIEKGTSLQLLPSTTLERIIADVNGRSSADYRLWGRITKYKGSNFIFPMFFLPISEIKEPGPQVPQPQEAGPSKIPAEEEAKWEPVINEPNDILAVPQEIIEKLDARRAETSRRPGSEMVKRSTVRPSGGGADTAFQQDSILVNRTGFISPSYLIRAACPADKNMQYGFAFDALGRNISKASLRLLPCEALERAVRKQSAELESMKFQIAGIATRYKDQNYLLLQKATRVYDYGNFAE